MGHLVRDDHPAGLPFGLGDRVREQELVAEGDAARVLHRSGLELGDERLVVGIKGIRLGEDLQVAVEAGPGDGEDLRCVPVQRPGQRSPAVQAERDAAVLAADAVVGARDQREQVTGDRRGGRQVPAKAAPGPGRSRGSGHAVAEHGPGVRRDDGGGHGRLQVRLVEGGEHPLCVIQPGVQGEVGFPVGGVGEAVQAGAVARVRHVGLDPQYVGVPQAGQRQPVAAQRPRIQLPAVEHRSAQPGGPEFDEAGRAGLPAAKPDVGDRAERVLAAAEVKVDVVSADVDQPGALLRLGVGQRTRGCSRYRRDWPSLAPPDPYCGSATNRHQLRIGLARSPETILE